MPDAMTRVAETLVGGGRGILAADESPATMDARLEAMRVTPGPEMRRAYRSMLVGTPGLRGWVSGVILSDDILHGTTVDGQPFVEACGDAGILAGVKVDAGARPLAGAPGERVTEGLDRLRERLAGYAAMGATFTTWRAVIRIDGVLPSEGCLHANAHALARYAALAQEAGLVPIVEPEVLMDGAHSIRRAAEVTEAALASVFDELDMQRVRADAIVLKPNMVTPGADAPVDATVDDVAGATVGVLMRQVPPTVPGIAFLSGGQPAQVACARLARICRLGPHPWEVTFSFGRALVDASLRAWAGEPGRVRAGQGALAQRARASAAARTVVAACG